MTVNNDNGMTEIYDAENVVLMIRDDGQAVWVLVDGACVLRISTTPQQRRAGGTTPVVVLDQRGSQSDQNQYTRG